MTCKMKAQPKPHRTSFLHRFLERRERLTLGSSLVFLPALSADERPDPADAENLKEAREMRNWFQRMLLDKDPVVRHDFASLPFASIRFTDALPATDALAFRLGTCGMPTRGSSSWRRGT